MLLGRTAPPDEILHFATKKERQALQYLALLSFISAFADSAIC